VPKRYVITKGYGKWSSMTVVEDWKSPNKDYRPPKGHRLVKHVPTDSIFTCPVEILTEKRNR
jgi:hypothetical protein